MFDWQAELATSVPAPVSFSARLDSSLAFEMVAHKTPLLAVNLKSFTQALRGPQINYSEPLPAPSIRGETLSIKITSDAYFRGLEACKTNFRGRLILNKGDKPYSSKDLFAKLQKVWKVIGPWSLLSLGRGFYEFSFASHEDLRTVWEAGTVNLKPGVL